LTTLVSRPWSGRFPPPRAALQVLAVAGLLADEDDVGVCRALAEDRLRGVLPERTGLAPGCSLAQLLQARTVRDKSGSGAVAVNGELAHADRITRKATLRFLIAAPWPRG
jgi:hypothetical protein